MNSRTITTSAVGQSEAPPELATIEGLAIGEGTSASDAKAVAEDRAATIRKSITDVSTDDIRTTNIQVNNTDELFDPATQSPYQAKEYFEITCLPDKVEPAVTAVTTAGGAVQTIHFHLREDTHQTLQDEALTQAAERAREKAEVIASAEGLAVADVQTMTTDHPTPGMDSIVDKALASDSETDVHPTPITVSEKVEAKYELTEK